LESRRVQLQDSLAGDMAAKKAAFLKETARAEQLLKTRDFLKPYAAEVTAASLEQARYGHACGCVRVRQLLDVSASPLPSACPWTCPCTFCHLLLRSRKTWGGVERGEFDAAKTQHRTAQLESGLLGSQVSKWG
jgi:hypothetical protein